MDFELQTICVIRPAYFTITVLLLLATTVASGISAVIATLRRIRGANTTSRHIRTFHFAVVVVWLAYATVVGFGAVNDRRFLREHEKLTRKPAPAVRAAMNRELKHVVSLGGVCVAIGVLSMLAWRGRSRDVADNHVARTAG